MRTWTAAPARVSCCIDALPPSLPIHVLAYGSCYSLPSAMCIDVCERASGCRGVAAPCMT